MKRECLLSKSYTGPPLTFKDAEICYSGMANEILRELNTAFFCGDGDGEQTHYHGLVEGVLVMSMLANEDYAGINDLRMMSKDERRTHVLTFGLDNEAEIERLRPEVIARVESAMAASVESEGSGKSQPQRQDCLP